MVLVGENTIKASDFFVAALENEGVEYIFWCVGRGEP